VGVLTRRNIVIVLIVHRAHPQRCKHQSGGPFRTTGARSTDKLFAIFVIVDAVAEAAVGLGILIALFRNKETVLADEIDLLKMVGAL